MKSLLMVVLCFVSTSLFAQPLIHSAFSMASQNVNVRSLSLGNAVVSQKGSFGDYHINPAGVELKDALSLSATRIEFFDEDVDRNVSAVFGTGNSTVGLSIRMINAIQPPFLEINLPAYPRFNSEETYLTLFYNHSFGENLSIGLGINRLRSSTSSGSLLSEQRVGNTTAWSLDVGAQYQQTIPVNEQLFVTPGIGFSITDFGKGVNYYRPQERYSDPLPGIMRLGMGALLETSEEVYGKKKIGIRASTDISKTLNRREEVYVNSVYEYRAMNPFEELIDTWKSYEYFDGQRFNTIPVGEQFWFHYGIELQALESFFLRWGHQKAPEYDDLNTYRAIGLGIDVYYFVFDYSFHWPKKGNDLDKSYHLYGPHWQVTARFPLDGNHPDTILSRFF